MPAAIAAVAATIGAEYIGAVVAGKAFEFTTVLFAKAAFSAGLSLVAESLRETPSAPSFTNEAQNRKQLVRTSNGPRRAIYGTVGRVSGNLAYIANGTDAGYVHIVIALADHSSQAINDGYLGDEKVGALDASGNCTEGRFAGHVRIRKYLGTQTAPDPDLSAECPEWGARNRVGTGVTYVYLRIKRSRDVFPQGLPTPRFDVVGKNDILDPRTGLTGHTDNAALCALDYIQWKRGFNSSLDEVDQDSWIAAANVCDEDVAVPGGGTQKRYRVNGSFTLDQGRAQVLDNMRQAMAGMANYIMGRWYGGAGAAEAPVMDIDERDLRGPYRVRPRVSDDKVYNAVRGTYTETAHWTETDFPPITSSVYEAQDGGERLTKDVKLSFETDAYRAQRLAKIDLERHRQQVVVDWPMRIRGIRLRPWNIVRLTVPRLGWANKPFRVVGWEINLTGGPMLTLEEYAPEIYAMSVSDLVTVDPAPDTNLPNPFTVAAPAALTLSSGSPELLRLADGTVISRIRAAWPTPSDAYVRGGELQYRVAGGEWQPGPLAPDAQAGFAHIGPMIDGDEVEARLRFENGLGVRSGWTLSAAHVVIGKTAAPSAVSGVALTQEMVFFGKVADLDVIGYEIRAIPGEEATWSLGVAMHDGLVTDSPYAFRHRLTGVQTIMVAAVDSGRRYGLPGHATLDFGAIDPYNVAQTVDFKSAGFPGDITNAAISGGDLVANLDPAADHWSIGGEDYWTRGDAAADFWAGDAYLALGYVARLRPAYTGGDLIIDSAMAGARVGLNWRTDGATVGDFWALGADFWSGGDFYGAMPAWQPYIGAIASRADQGILIRASVDAGPVRGAVSALSIRLQMPDKQQVFTNVAIAAGGTRLAPTDGSPAVEWVAIEEVNFTVVADGSGATSGRVIDFDPVLGAMVETLNAAGMAVSSAGQSVRLSGY